MKSKHPCNTWAATRWTQCAKARALLVGLISLIQQTASGDLSDEVTRRLQHSSHSLAQVKERNRLTGKYVDQRNIINGGEVRWRVKYLWLYIKNIWFNVISKIKWLCSVSLLTCVVASPLMAEHLNPFTGTASPTSTHAKKKRKNLTQAHRYDLFSSYLLKHFNRRETRQLAHKPHVVFLWCFEKL